MAAEHGEKTQTPPRADRLRNRHRILVVARELFAQRSPGEVQLEDVALAAGVSRATLFRHIQSKDALIAEIYAERVADIRGLAHRALEEPDPWNGFALFIRTSAKWMHEDRGLYEFSARLRRDAPDDERYLTILAAVDEVIDRARRADLIDGDFALPDLLPLLGYTVAAPADRLEYFTQLLLNGLSRTRGASDTIG